MLVGKLAPYFKATAVVNGGIEEGFTLSRYKGKQYVLLFFYPKDFTLVCPTELWGFQKALPEFEARETAVVACPTDSEFSHWAWAHMPQDKGGIIRHMVVNDMPLGRSVKEALRMVDALQHWERHGEVCPLDWESSDK